MSRNLVLKPAQTYPGHAEALVAGKGLGWRPPFWGKLDWQNSRKEITRIYGAPLSLLSMALLFCAGCSLLPPQVTRNFVAPYKPQNVYVWGSGLPPQIHRVALLPVACEKSVAEAAEGRDTLEPALRLELSKAHRFEVSPVSADALATKTGQATWSCEEALPPDLFPWLSQAYGCDAVLFCKLTVFHGYAPLAVGWRMRLVDLHTRSTIWAVDEVVDCALPAVQAGARQYEASVRQSSPIGPDEWMIDNSPRQFGQYATAQLLATLPGL